MNNDLCKSYSFFSEPSSEENKKQTNSMTEFKDPINPAQNFFEETAEKDYWVGQLSPTLSGIRSHENLEFNPEDTQPFPNSSPASMFSHDVEVLAIYHTSHKEKHHHNLVLKDSRKPEIFKQRKNFGEETSKILKKWLSDHKEYPYPSLDQLNNLCQLTGLSSKQIRTYFVNNRSRFLLRSPKGGKVIKSQKFLKEEIILDDDYFPEEPLNENLTSEKNEPTSIE